MKPSSVAAALVVAFAACLSTSEVRAQAAAPAAPTVHKVGLIDMAFVFKNYKKFEALREDLKQEITAGDSKAKALAEKIKDGQAQMKKFKEGSPEFVKVEKELLALTGEFEAFRKGAQRDLMRREADIYKTVYLEVMDTVQKYAQHYNYTLVIRFSRDGVESDDDPSKVVQGMNRQVVYFRGEDDITDSVLDYLNRRYQATAKLPLGPAGGAAATPPRTSSAAPGTRPAN